MTVLRRVKTLENHEQKQHGAIPNTCITVSKDAVYKDKEGAVIHKEGGVWMYADNSLMPVSGLVVILREGHTP